MTQITLPLENAWEAEEPLEGWPCTSPAEAFALARDEACSKITEIRDNWWRYRWLATFRIPTEEFRDAARRASTSPQTLALYLNVVADYSNKAGTDPIYAFRESISKQMHRSVKTVERCRKAAVGLGYHSRGHQAVWLDETKPGPNPWCAGSAVVVLTMPDKGLWPASEKADKVRERVRRRRLATDRRNLERKQKRDAEHQARLEALIDAADAPATKPEPPRRRPPRRFDRAALGLDTS